MGTSLLSTLGAVLLLSAPASAVTMDWTFVGNPSNPTDTITNCGAASLGTGCGSVPYAYYVSKYEVTNAQYAELLNAKAASDPLDLYNTNMGTVGSLGGITRSGSPGSYTYSAIPDRENMPVNWVTFYDAVRFANWLSNGQGSGDTETGAYTLLGGTPTPSNGNINVRRNADAQIFLTSENEWYKAAYYDSSSMSYFDYPARSNTPTTCATPGPAPNIANCGNAVRDFTSVGSYTGSASPYGTFDQGGNVSEWTEAVPFNLNSDRQLRGGSIAVGIDSTALSGKYSNFPFTESAVFGFRVAAMIPEPGTGLLVITGLLGLVGWRRARNN